LRRKDCGKTEKTEDFAYIDQYKMEIILEEEVFRIHMCVPPRKHVISNEDMRQNGMCIYLVGGEALTMCHPFN
jgi:hypothetical protein